VETIKQQLDKLEEKIRQIQVNDNEYESWKHHPVTQRFMLETQYAMMLAMFPFDYDGPTDDVGLTALRTNFSKGLVEAFELTLEWYPTGHLEEG